MVARLWAGLRQLEGVTTQTELKPCSIFMQCTWEQNVLCDGTVCGIKFSPIIR